jgi:hypothetical protein
VVVTFVVEDLPSLTRRRFELLGPAALHWESAAGSFRAEFPPDTASAAASGEQCDPGAALHAIISRRAGRTVVRIRVRPWETDADAVPPPREARRDDLRDALAELLTAPTTVPGTPGQRSVFYWSLSTLTIFGTGEEFLLRLRETRFRRPLFDRLVTPWAARRSRRRLRARSSTLAVVFLLATLLAFAVR